ncbi:RNA polymerase sigma factor (plasmid) [Rhizobium sp. NIBRBAC000502774]|nr:RNA polymerase sigma factor [Rhizobium sp. NIBRBAC000502774]
MADSQKKIEDLYRSHRNRLEHIAQRKVGADDASDVVHDVFTNIWTRSKEIADISASYLARATQFTAISHFRSRKRREGYFKAITEEQYAASPISPDQVVIGRQELEHFRMRLMSLPERTRQVFLLRRIHACTYNDIAAGLGISYSTVEREMARALLACKTIENGATYP